MRMKDQLMKLEMQKPGKIALADCLNHQCFLGSKGGGAQKLLTLPIKLLGLIQIWLRLCFLATPTAERMVPRTERSQEQRKDLGLKYLDTLCFKNTDNDNKVLK